MAVFNGVKKSMSDWKKFFIDSMLNNPNYDDVPIREIEILSCDQINYLIENGSMVRC